MSVTAFNTLEYAERLKKAGCNDALANEQSQFLAEVLSGLATTHLCTKSELNDAKIELKQDISNIRTEILEIKNELKQDITNLKVEIKSLETNLFWSMVKIVSFATGLISVLMAVFHFVK